jgi:putative DNA primase/helicase
VVAVTIPDVRGFSNKAAAREYLDKGDGLLLPIRWFTAEKKGKAAKVAIGMKGRQYARYETDHAEISGWSDISQCGLVTSRSSGLLVFDLDDPAAFRAWRTARGLQIPPTAYAATGRDGGGIHLLFDARELPGELWPATQDAIWPGENFGELKCNGFIAAEPAVHPSGRRYQWMRREILPLNQSLIDFLASRKAVMEAKRAGAARGLPGDEVVPVGRQHFAMLRMTTAKVREGWSDEDVTAWCLGKAAGWPSRPGDPWRAEVILRDYVRTARLETARSDAAQVVSPEEAATLGAMKSITQGSEKLSARRQAKLTGEIVPGPGKPVEAAAAFLGKHLHRGLSTIISWRGDFYRWDGAQWNETEPVAIRTDLYHWLRATVYLAPRATPAHPDKTPERKPWDPNTTTVNRVLDALLSISAIPWDTEPGDWLVLTGDRFANGGKPPFVSETSTGDLVRPRSGLLSVPTPVISLKTAILDVKTRVLHPCSPSLFSLSSINFLTRVQDIRELGHAGTLSFEAPEWITFLKSVWPDDEDSIRLLRQWFGYVLSGDTSRQKIMLMVGPKRSGKGTIGRVLRALMTSRNVASPTTETLKDRFGLSSLIGKSLAIVSDARFDGWGVQTAVERLLAISGEDAIDVDRKNRPIWNGRLGVRFMIMSNKIPALLDSSGAIASRFLVLQMTSSWLGKEDRGLEARLMAELPGILFWALDGMFELEDQEQFTVPESAAEAHASMEGLSSPHTTFAEEMCNRDETAAVPCQELFQAWQRWCERQGRKDAGNAAVFGRDLRAALPWISRRRVGGRGEREWAYQGLSMRDDTDDEGAMPTVKDMKRKS